MEEEGNERRIEGRGGIADSQTAAGSLSLEEEE
jgi:hypothetical protein